MLKTFTFISMDRLGQSLDDIIASRPKQDRGNKKGGRGGGRGGSKQGTKVVFRSEKKVGKVKATSQTVIRQPFVKKQITERVGKVSTGSIFDRLGTGAPAPKSNIVSGTQVLFANLRPDIVSGDIAELCGTVGEVKQVDIILNKSGRSTVMSIISCWCRPISFDYRHCCCCFCSWAHPSCVH